MDNENPKTQTGGLRLMTIFIIVLILHVIVIGGISAYHLFSHGGGDHAATVAKTDADKETTDATTADGAKTDDHPNIADSATGSGEATKADAPTIETNADATSAQPNDAPIGEKPSTAATTPVATTTTTSAATTETTQPATVSTPAPTTTTTAAITNYKVKAGDTLYKVSHKFNVKVAMIKQLNGLKSNVLRIGQTLKLGTTNAIATATVPTAPAVATTTAPTTTDASSPVLYTVMKGDTLAKIARQFKTTSAALMTANNLTDPRKLSIGAKLKIPTQEARNEATPTVANPKPFKVPPTQSSDLVMVR